MIGLASVPGASVSGPGKILEIVPGSGFVVSAESEGSCRVVFCLGLKQRKEVAGIFISLLLKNLRETDVTGSLSKAPELDL